MILIITYVLLHELQIHFTLQTFIVRKETLDPVDTTTAYNGMEGNI